MRRSKSQFEQDLNRYLAPLRALPFVQRLDVQPPSQATSDRRVDAWIVVRTRRRAFKLAVEVKLSYLDHLFVSMLAQQAYLLGGRKIPLLLVARYIPEPTGERLAKAGINFVDAVGNYYLNLGNYFHASVTGRREAKLKPAERQTSSAVVKVMSAFLIDENATTWPVRKLAEVAGVHKTAAAEARQRLTQKGILVESRTGLHIANKKTLEEDFFAGYEHILRPNLWIGTFRSDRDHDALLRKIREEAKSAKIGWALTGAQAAFVLERRYPSERTTFFWDGPPERLDGLNLVPDDKATVTVLRSFGTIFPWRIQSGMPLAHPLLICAELLCEGEPKTLETAAHIRMKYLAK